MFVDYQKRYTSWFTEFISCVRIDYKLQNEDVIKYVNGLYHDFT